MQLLFEYIKKYKLTYIGVVIIFTIGMIIGTVAMFKTSSEDREEIGNYISETKQLLIDNKENKQEIFVSTFLQNFKFTIIIWLLGCTIIAGFTIYIFIIYKGFLLGYIISIFIRIFGLKEGIILLCILLLGQNVLFLPSLFLLATSGIRLYKGIIKKESNLKYELIRHAVILAICIGIIIMSSCLSAYILPIFL